jgi:hypothetical protein
MEKKKIAIVAFYGPGKISEFALKLIALNFEVLAANGTATYLSAAGVEFTDITSILKSCPDESLPRIDWICFDTSGKIGLESKPALDNFNRLILAAKGNQLIVNDDADLESVISWLEDGYEDPKIFIKKLAIKAGIYPTAS